jgi:putative hydrolase of the HAD superfamily
MQKIKNIILDLGGVLLNLNFKKTEEAFRALGIEDFNTHFSQFQASPLFEDLEVGRVSPFEFFEHFRRETGLALTDEAIIESWNAMLLDFPPERLQWLEELGKKYRVFLYSNTNSIHYDSFHEAFERSFPGKNLNNYFEKAYYSHILGKRKPFADSFRIILEDAGLLAEETVFIDDTIGNIEGAREAGINAIHLVPGKTVLDIKESDLAF